MRTTQLAFNVIVFCLFSFEINAQAISLQNADKFPLNITTSVEIFKDSTASIPLVEITQKPFYKSTKDHFLFPYSNDVFWVRFNLKNTDSSQENYTLIWSNPLVEQLDFYIADNSEMKNFLHKQQKIITSERDKKFIDQDPKFVFDLKPNQTKTIYIKLTSKRGHYAELRLHTKDSYTKFRMDDFSGQGFLNGLMFFRLFLVLVLSFFVVNDLSFRLFSLYTVIRTFNYWGYINIAGPLFTDIPELAQKIDYLCYNSGTLGTGIFILVAFLVHKLSKVHIYLISFFLVINVFFNVIIFVDYQWYWLKAGVYTLVYSAAYYILLNVYFIIKKVTFAKYYSILFIFGLLSTFLLNVRLLGWIEMQPIYTLSYYFFFAEFFFFIFFLGRIFRNTELIKILTEQQLKFNIEQNRKLKELDNLKTTFFTNISHELRTPLTLITGPFQQLADKYPTDKLIPLIQRNTDRLLKLINQLLDISKLEAGQMKPEISQQNITQYLRTLTSSFASLAESREINFERHISKTETYGFIDRDKIEKIVTNLLSNAFKFTPKNGLVRISTKFDELQKTMSIEVNDTGIGIESEKLNKIFDRFFQVDDTQNRKYEGTGIGLALVKELVAVLKGKISVNSQKDVGTTFTVSLPIDMNTWKGFIIETSETTVREPDFESKPSEKVTTEQDVLLDNENILLIVDDNEDIRKYLRSIFEKEYKIIEAVNGKDGIEKATAQVPDIIISDLMMPEMDGFEFCKFLKADEKTSHIPIVMLTAKANIESRIEGFELGADDYLTKPFNSQEMQARVKNLLVIREKLNKYYQKNNNQKPLDVKVNVIDEHFIKKVTGVLDTHLSDSQFSIEQLAGELSLSPTQLRRKIKALSNQTIVEFIRNYRLEKAAQLLRQNAGNVSEIAFNVGFDSLSYFGKVFQEIYGVLPSEYKEKVQK
ncbi:MULTISPECIES: response regulator [Emticicia]|uniref:response regulator n=1 Tax=Emticicia TaxID=312278 RepID=UPI0007D8B9F9|nr:MULTISPECIES: response regulator [Emticicia]